MLVYKACHVNTGIDIVRIDYRGINKIFSFKLIRILKEIMSKTTEKQEIWCIHEVEYVQNRYLFHTKIIIQYINAESQNSYFLKHLFGKTSLNVREM